MYRGSAIGPPAVIVRPGRAGEGGVPGPWHRGTTLDPVGQAVPWPRAAEGADARRSARGLGRGAGRVAGDGGGHAAGAGGRPRRGRVVTCPNAAAPDPGDRRVA